MSKRVSVRMKYFSEQTPYPDDDNNFKMHAICIEYMCTYQSQVGGVQG